MRTVKTERERLASALVRMGYTYAEFYNWSTDYMKTVVTKGKRT